VDTLELLTRYAIVATEKQYRLAEVVGERPWQLSLESGRLSFGDDLAYSVQILGTESYKNGSWMWGWGNKASSIPERLLAAAVRMREYGAQHRIRPLEERTFLLEVATGYALSSIGSGLLDAAAYYRAPFDEGAVYLLIDDTAFPRDREPAAERMVRAIRKGLQSFDIDHADALAAYAELHHGSVEQNGVAFTLRLPSGARLRGRLEAGKVAQIEPAE
jgi:hypothetical protein